MEQSHKQTLSILRTIPSSGRFLSSILILVLYLSTNVSIAKDGQKELIFLTWSEFIDETLLSRFENDYGVKVTRISFESDDMRDEFILDANATGIDLIISSGVSLKQYKKRGWLSKLEQQKIPNLRHLDDKWRNAFPEARDYGVPYFWGTIGIAYRKDLVKEPFTSWKQFYQPAEYLRGKIAMIKYSRDLIGMGLKSLGYSANSTRPAELQQVENLLLKQKPYVKAYSYLSLGIAGSKETPALFDGTLIAAMGYSGDVLTLQAQDSNIQFVTPEEGSNIWVDYLAVMSGAKNKEAAWQFINFLNEPEVAAQNALYLHYPSPNKTAESLLPNSHLNNPIIYPDKKVLEKSEFYEELPARTLKQRNTIFSNVVN